MKTTKADREAFVEQSIPLFEKESQYWKRKFVRDVCDDVDSLREKLATAVEALKDPDNHWHYPNEALKSGEVCTACEALAKIEG